MVGHAEPDRVLRVAEVELDPLAPAAHQRQRSRPPALAARADDRLVRRVHQRGRLPGVGAEDRDRRGRGPALQVEQLGRGLLVGGQGGDPVERVRGEQHDTPVEQRLHDRVDDAIELRRWRRGAAGRPRAVSQHQRGPPRRGRGRSGPRGWRHRRTRPARARSSTASPWSSPISTTRVPPGRSQVGASATMRRTWSSPSSPPNSARCGSWSRTWRATSAPSGTYGGLATTTSKPRVQLAGQRVEPVALGQAHHAAAATEPGGVGPGDRQRVGRRIGGPDLDVRPALRRDRQRDGPRSRAEVDDPAAGRHRVDGEAGDHLGLRPRDQHPRVDVEVERAEAPLAEHVLQRLPRRPSLHHRVEGGGVAGVGHVVERRGLLRGGQAAGPLDDPAHLLVVVEDAGGAASRSVAARCAVGGHSLALSRAVCSAATSASITSSSSPARTLSSL